MDHNLIKAWNMHDVKSAIEILDSMKSNELENNGFSLLRNIAGHHEGDPVYDSQMEILRLYLNKRAEHIPYNVNDSIIKSIERNYISYEEVGLLCDQIDISTCNTDQRTKLIKLLILSLKEYTAMIKDNGKS